MPEPVSLAVIVGTFLLAGAVKGVLGLGLPTISLGLLVAVIDLPTAMALLIVPSFFANVWQAVAGGHAREILRRIWPFLVMATVTVWFGAMALARVDLSLLSGFLGGILVTYAVINLQGIHFTISARQETWAGPLIGTANGIVTGMTGSSVVPGIIFLQGIGLPREMLVQAMGILFAASTLALGVALRGQDLLTGQLAVLSSVALVPTLLGMRFGRAIRQRLPEQLFRKVFFFALLALGGYIIAQAAA